jgi:threonine dehydrogenase-like Zn-dependent dehydrogenase
MIALLYDQKSDKLELVKDRPIPVPNDNEALIRLSLAGICSTDLEIVKGYVPGFSYVLGHEFVGQVIKCTSRPDLEGRRVVGEINCNDGQYCCSDLIFQRNHAPGRSVLGIINKDGSMAEYLTLPVSNLHIVPSELTDTEAAFTEPLAAACRILEQGLPKPGSDVAVIGDGKLGLLVAAVLQAEGEKCRVTLVGRHASKMELVEGLHAYVLLPSADTAKTSNIDNGSNALPQDVLSELEGRFSLVVEASGSPKGVIAALRLTKPMGRLLLKSTVSVTEQGGVPWAQVANDIVVNEKVLIGSRCGPMAMALEVMTKHASIRRLLNGMVTAVLPLEEATHAFDVAKTKGAMKVHLCNQKV